MANSTAGFAPLAVRRLQLVQRAAQRGDLVLVGGFLAFSHFDQFEHFFHLLQRLFERFDNLPDFRNRLADLRRGGLCNGRRRLNFLIHRCRRGRGRFLDRHG